MQYRRHVSLTQSTMSVEKMSLKRLFVKQLYNKLTRKDWLSSPLLPTLKKYVFLGSSVLCVSPLQSASFFGPQWIQQTDSGLSVHASAVAIAPLLQEWCQVCQKQCVIDHEIKQKLSLNLDQTTCEELLEQLSSAVSVEQVSSGYAFKKQSKGSWAAYQCQHRSAQEMTELLKQVLSPAGKYEHFLTDNVSNLIWVPKTFFQHHQHLIQELDTPKQQYMAHINWLRVEDRNQQRFEGQNTLALIDRWLQGYPVTASLHEVAGWLQGLNQSGLAQTLAQASVLLVEGETTESTLSETVPVIKVDKKGGKSVVAQPQALVIKITPTTIEKDTLELVVLLEESSHGHTTLPQIENYQRFKSKVPLKIGSSIMLGGVSRQEAVKHKRCISILSSIPILGGLFCASSTALEARQYGLVLTVTEKSY